LFRKKEEFLIFESVGGRIKMIKHENWWALVLLLTQMKQSTTKTAPHTSENNSHFINDIIFIWAFFLSRGWRQNMRFLMNLLCFLKKYFSNYKFSEHSFSANEH
jgi:hypothetical protein